MGNCCVVRPEELEEPCRNSILILQMNVESCLLKCRQLCQQSRSEAEAEVLSYQAWSLRMLKSTNEEDGNGGCPTHRSHRNCGFSLYHPCLILIHGSSAGKTGRAPTPLLQRLQLPHLLSRMHSLPSPHHGPSQPSKDTAAFPFLGRVRNPSKCSGFHSHQLITGARANWFSPASSL